MLFRFLRLFSFNGALWLGLVLITSASAAPLEGTFNTGQSGADGGADGTLDVKFNPCKENPALVCGTVVRVVNDDPADTKTKMPDGSDLLGFVMVKGLKDKGEGKYRGGKINAVAESLHSGEMAWYGLKVDVLEDGRLEMKGCVGFICPETFFWAPADPLEPVSEH